MAKLSFYTGFAILHKLGLEELFRTLCNTPVSALMDLNIYALIGSLPYAILTGAGLGILLGRIIVRIRKKMIAAGQHEIVGKTIGNRFSRILLRLAFGKSKLSPDEDETKSAPLFRKAGLILAGSVLLINLLMEFFFLDMTVKKGLQKSISAMTGAQVDIEDAHLSIAKGDLEISHLEITDPDKPTHNLIQIKTLKAKLSVRDLLADRFTIDLLSGSTVKHDVLRKTPGAIYPDKAKKAKEKKAEKESDNKLGKALGDYFTKAETIEKYGEKAYRYLEAHREKAQEKALDEDAARLQAERLGYRSAFADFSEKHPKWLIHRIEILDVEVIKDQAKNTIVGTEFCSNPRLNGKPFTLAILPTRSNAAQDADALAAIELHFENADTPHTLQIHLNDIALSEKLETSDSFPITLKDGRVDISTDGTFSLDGVELPFSLQLNGLQARVDEGEEVLGMDAKTATEVFSSIEKLQITGTLLGPLYAPRVQIDHEQLMVDIKTALIAAGKNQLANRAGAEMDKYTGELQEKVNEQVDDLKSRLNDKIGEEAGSILGDTLDGATEGAAQNLLNGFLKKR